MTFYSKKVKLLIIARLCFWNNSPFVYSQYPPAPRNSNNLTGMISISTGAGKYGDNAFTSTQTEEGRTSDILPKTVNEAESVETEKLPGDGSHFEQLISSGEVFVDKTKHLLLLLEEEHQMYFFSRPRRIGKTITVEMLESFFKGRSKFFNNTYIYNFGNTVYQNGTWIAYPTIYLDFSGIETKYVTDHTEPSDAFNHVSKQISNKLLSISNDEYHLNLTRPVTISDLIEELYLKSGLPVVVLIDEYDCLINHAIMKTRNKVYIQQISDLMETFFKNIKSSSTSILLSWITGVHRYAFEGLDSSANNFQDLSNDKRFSTLVGFTAEEIEKYFPLTIRDFAKSINQTPEHVMDELHRWYDGYNFNNEITSASEESNIYNTISVLNSLRNKKFGTYWCNTGGAPQDILDRWFIECRFSIKDMKNEKIEICKLNYNPRSPVPLIPFMINTGYLKIVNHKGDHVFVDFPNKEVEIYMDEQIDDYIPGIENGLPYQQELLNGLLMNLHDVNIQAAVDIFNKLAFPTFKHPLDNPAMEYEVTRRLCRELFWAGIEFSQKKLIDENEPDKNRREKKDIDIILTRNLNVNYAIEIKVGNYEEKGYHQQIMSYFLEHFTPFQAAIEYENKINLLTLTFGKSKNNRIQSWVLIPCEGEMMLMKQLSASSTDLAVSAKEYYQKLKGEAKDTGKN
ncbi:uncharacterized protein LOC135839843 [Planococcus citri]|uniref:uncharacterized protein LOC135839843 n=1 Tax=Planococcus citri TaxID=170843 RepID=UPI0031F9B56F